jgi:hypothetical protein
MHLAVSQPVSALYVDMARRRSELSRLQVWADLQPLALVGSGRNIGHVQLVPDSKKYRTGLCTSELSLRHKTFGY